MNNPFACLKRHPLLTFFTLAYSLAWLAWPLYTVHRFPVPIFAFSPSLAAILVVAMTGGKADLRTLFSRLLRWRVGWRWYAVALLAPIPLFFTVVYLNVQLGAPAPTRTQLAAWPNIAVYFLSFLLNPLGGAWEELGWRGYAQPRLQEDRSALTASVILGALWAGWHLPLFLTGMISWPDLMVVFVFGILYAWLFNHSKGSVLIAYLSHAAVDAAAGFFMPLFSGADQARVYWILAAVLAVVATSLVIRHGPTLVRKPALHVGTTPARQPLAIK